PEPLRPEVVDDELTPALDRHRHGERLDPGDLRDVRLLRHRRRLHVEHRPRLLRLAVRVRRNMSVLHDRNPSLRAALCGPSLSHDYAAHHTPMDQKKTDGTRVPSVACSPFQKHSARVLTPPR